MLAVSPFLVEVLDGRTQILDRNMKPKTGGPDEPDTCYIMRIETIDRASQAIVASLRLNDLMMGRLALEENARRPEVFVEAKQVVAGIWRVTAPVRYLHTPPLAGCWNRSGRLLEDPEGVWYDSLTVYNDGAIDYRDTLQRHFNRETLSDQELSELLRAFGTVNFDAVRGGYRRPTHGPDTGDYIDSRALSRCLARRQGRAPRTAGFQIERGRREVHVADVARVEAWHAADADDCAVAVRARRAPRGLYVGQRHGAQAP